MSSTNIPDLDTFTRLPVNEVADLVRVYGPKTCVFPINGTRRWFMFEHGYKLSKEELTDAYVEIVSQAHADLYKLIFDHGIDTLVAPSLGVDILLRGNEYMQNIGEEGLRRLASHPLFLQFYEDYDVRIHFYGEYIRHLQSTPYASVCTLFNEAVRQTRNHHTRRLFLGVFAADATQSIIEFSAKYYTEHGKIPDKKELIEMYYGEYVNPADIFIGFDKFSVFDYPLLATGEEALYFTVSPSPYMTPQQLRNILYDYMYIRKVNEPDYSLLSTKDIHWFQDFYRENSNVTLGTGTIRAGIWIPACITEQIK